MMSWVARGLILFAKSSFFDIKKYLPHFGLSIISLMLYRLTLTVTNLNWQSVAESFGQNFTFVKILKFSAPPMATSGMAIASGQVRNGQE